MPPPSCDVIVAGLGALGAATAWQLASRGHRVIGVDRHHPPHTLGSTHGRSRIIREAYFEHPLYVPIVQRAFSLWADLEQSAGVRLFQACGGLMIGRPGSALFAGASSSASAHALQVQTWSAADLRERVPALRPSDDMVALFEPRAGVLAPERAVTAMIERAGASRADLIFDTPVRAWRALDTGVAVDLADGRTLTARRLVLAAGGWLPALAGVALPLTVERAVQYWYPTGGDPRFTPARLPIFLMDLPDGRMIYGLPDQGDGLKIAEHHRGWTGPLDALDRTVGDEERRAFRALAAPYVADLPEQPGDARVCFYTNTPDEHFLLDRHPASAAVYLASACSGHGFKFVPALGELIARDLEEDETAAATLAPFRLSRFEA